MTEGEQPRALDYAVFNAAKGMIVDGPRRKWRAKTECREAYVTSDCSNSATVVKRTAALEGDDVEAV